MLDNKAKNIIDVNEIKGVMVEVMLEKCNGRTLKKADLSKFFKYLNLQQKGNTSKNSIDCRIASLYKNIQKLYEDFQKLNAIITELD